MLFSSVQPFKRSAADGSADGALLAPSSAWGAGLGRQPGGDECAVFDAKENSRRNPSSAPWVVSLSVGGGGGSNQLGAAREGSAAGL